MSNGEILASESFNFLLGMALGFSLAAPPGPANAVIAYFSTTDSRLSGFVAGMGASSADTIILSLILFTGFADLLTELAGKNLFLVGGIVMLLLAVMILKRLNTRGEIQSSRSRISKPYLAGLVTNISSPYTITWWLTVGLTLATTLGIAVFGFFTSLMVWNIFFPSLLAFSRRKVPRIQKYVTVFATVTLGGFGIWFLLRYILS